jgi:hypothetical protein
LRDVKVKDVSIKTTVGYSQRSEGVEGSIDREMKDLQREIPLMIL